MLHERMGLNLVSVVEGRHDGEYEKNERRCGRMKDRNVQKQRALYSHRSATSSMILIEFFVQDWRHVSQFVYADGEVVAVHSANDDNSGNGIEGP